MVQHLVTYSSGRRRSIANHSCVLKLKTYNELRSFLNSEGSREVLWCRFSIRSNTYPALLKILSVRHNDNLATTESLSASQKTTIEKQTINSSTIFKTHKTDLRIMNVMSEKGLASTVNIVNVTEDDFGPYTCFVSNHLGNDFWSAFLTK
ncbi:unnamed protein product [Pocillopora meandrina]|uniref:Immunoglobulin-like beta-sandwich domain-containing protein n=1 Tax=Pocillopora meandrina TaxID=46732 RepID=A0AAU9WR31_9CNID|nr:unnamed protein product [Pocillopora meandrina]